MTFDLVDKPRRQTRERVQAAADHAKDALDSGLAFAGNKAKDYAHRGAVQLERARDHLPARFQRPSMTMVVTALGAGVLVGLLLSGKATSAIGDLSKSGKDALRRHRLTSLKH